MENCRDDNLKEEEIILRIEPSLEYVLKHLLYIKLIRVVQITCD